MLDSVGIKARKDGSTANLPSLYNYGRDYVNQILYKQFTIWFLYSVFSGAFVYYVSIATLDTILDETG